MRIYDISVSIQNGTFVFPGDPGIEIKPFLSKEKGDLANVSLISFGTHSGTHVDPPLHLWNGAVGVDALSLESLVGDTMVVELDVPERISADDLEGALTGISFERVLIKTRNSALWNEDHFREDFVYLAPDGAEWLVKHGAKLVGFDYLSLEGFNLADLPSHEALLKAKIVVVEGLDLSKVGAGEYMLVCLPLKIVNGDGGPARAILIEK